MILKHVGIVCGSEEKSDKFYENLLGLKKTSSKVVPSSLSKQIFNLDFEYKIVNYTNKNIHIEIFIDDHKKFNDKKIEHVCIEVDDLNIFLDRCRNMEVNITQIPKKDGFLTFIRDYDGNLFEIKENLGVILERDKDE